MTGSIERSWPPITAWQIDVLHTLSSFLTRQDLKKLKSLDRKSHSIFFQIYFSRLGSNTQHNYIVFKLKNFATHINLKAVINNPKFYISKPLMVIRVSQLVGIEVDPLAIAQVFIANFRGDGQAIVPKLVEKPGVKKALLHYVAEVLKNRDETTFLDHVKTCFQAFQYFRQKNLEKVDEAIEEVLQEESIKEKELYGESSILCFLNAISRNNPNPNFRDRFRQGVEASERGFIQKMYPFIFHGEIPESLRPRANQLKNFKQDFAQQIHIFSDDEQPKFISECIEHGHSVVDMWESCFNLVGPKARDVIFEELIKHFIVSNDRSLFIDEDTNFNKCSQLSPDILSRHFDRFVDVHGEGLFGLLGQLSQCITLCNQQLTSAQVVKTIQLFDCFFVIPPEIFIGFISFLQNQLSESEYRENFEKMPQNLVFKQVFFSRFSLPERKNIWREVLDDKEKNKLSYDFCFGMMISLDSEIVQNLIVPRLLPHPEIPSNQELISFVCMNLNGFILSIEEFNQLIRLLLSLNTSKNDKMFIHTFIDQHPEVMTSFDDTQIIWKALLEDLPKMGNHLAAHYSYTFYLAELFKKMLQHKSITVVEHYIVQVEKQLTFGDMSTTYLYLADIVPRSFYVDPQEHLLHGEMPSNRIQAHVRLCSTYDFIIRLLEIRKIFPDDVPVDVMSKIKEKVALLKSLPQF